MGEYDKAKTLNQDAFETKKRVLGVDNPSTLESGICLAISMLSMSELDTAERLTREILAAHTRVLGVDHRDTLSTQATLADILLKRCEPKQCLDIITPSSSSPEKRLRHCQSSHTVHFDYSSRR
eukprot:m.475891 g.475891  ORF g.475891 m.475891 type:complete len:124 (+) comp39308_c0_seq1:532-903(+)